MNTNSSVLLVLGAVFAWKFYQYRKAIWHNMNLYGNYMALLMKAKEDEIRKKKMK